LRIFVHFILELRVMLYRLEFLATSQLDCVLQVHANGSR
jgi:hypothetical protein